MPSNFPPTSGPGDFAAVYGPIASRIGAQLGVDPTTVLGQLGLETGWGKSIIPGTNNLGNIKDFAGGGVAATDNMTGSRDRYRAYPTPDAFADDYVSLIQRKYPGAMNAQNPQAFATALQAGGYAEDPRYVDKVTQAARMAGSAPGPVMNALGRAVGSMIPSANAQPLRKGSSMANPQADNSATEWDALDRQFMQGAPKQESGSDPWDALDAQFAQPAPSQKAPKAAQAAATERAPQAVTSTGGGVDGGGVDGGGVAGALNRGLGRVFPLATMAQTMRTGGMDVAAAKGTASGFADVGNTLLNAAAGGADSLMGPDNAISRWNAERQASLKDFNRENDSVSFGVGRLGGNIAATAPLGGAMGAGVKALGAVQGLTRAAPVLDALGSSIASGGFRTGAAPGVLGGQLGSMAARVGGGAIAGGASAGLVDPSSAGIGAAVGGALPAVFRAATLGSDLVGRGVRAVAKPDEVRAAEAIMQAGGYKTPEDIAQVRSALGAQGPNIVAEPPTVPQILQNPGISQLQRTLRNSGDTSLLQREAAQNQARFAALDRISPVTGTVQQSAENFGNALAPQVRAADEAARLKTDRAFEAVDPFNETRLHLPIAQMEAAKAKYLGPGTFGGGNVAQTAIDTARSIGTETLPAINAVRGAPEEGQTLLQAVRRAGGINAASKSGQGLAGELKDLRQTKGMGGLVRNGQGESVDRLAQRLHADGYLPDEDPATLLNALRDPDLANARPFSSQDGRGYQAAREAAQGDMPPMKEIPRGVPLRDLQNLRSSIGEAHATAQAKGHTREAAALDKMRTEIDTKANEVAAGRAMPGEHFPPDVVAQWQVALGVHQDRMMRYRTGPQASIFRQGGDGLPAAQGAELAPKFFSPRLSQADDMAAFQRVATPDTTAALKSYAVTDAANQTNRLGDLSNAKFSNWMDRRSGAVNGLFSEAERATLGGVGSDLARADAAQSLGMAVGSNTAQNVQSALGLGLLDNRALNIAASRVPVVGRFTGPMLDALKESAKRGKVEKLGGLLADPEALDRAIAESLGYSARRPGLLEGRSAVPLLLRTSPLLTTDR